MSWGGDAAARPPRVSFTALRTGETIEFPFTPETLEESVAVNYAQQTVVGLSHQIDQYGSTGNHTFSGLDLWFRGTTENEVERIHDARRFLLAHTLPSGGAQSVRDGGPSRILFFWPQLVSMTCKLTNLRIRHQQFNVQGRTTIFRASVDISEIRDYRLTSEEVRIFGTQRFNNPPEEL